MDNEDFSSSLDDSMRKLGKRVELMRKKNELSLMQNEVRKLEMELREMEIVGGHTPEAGTRESSPRSPRRRLPTTPSSRIRFREIDPPELHLYDESSIGGTLGANKDKKEGKTTDSLVQPVTSTPDVTKAKPQTGARLKPATYDGTGHWSDYKAHFDACAEINNWTEKEKGLYLAVSLRGQAQGVYGNLAKDSCKYDELAKALEERFAPPNQTELYRVQLKERRQRASETLTELGQDIWRLTNLTYATAPIDVRETLAKEQFIDCLHSSDMRLRIKQARPKSLNDAVRHAVELEAFVKAEKKYEGVGFMRTTNQKEEERSTNESDFKSLQDKLVNLQKMLEGMVKQSNQPRSGSYPSTMHQRGTDENNASVPRRPMFKRKCYECGSENHIKRNCPQIQEQIETEAKSDQQMKNVSSAGAGLYAKCKVNNMLMQCLIDTGATLTILSIDMWESIKPCSAQVLERYDGNVFTASGAPVEIKGKTTVSIEIDGMHCPCKVVVANIDLDLILGLDFFKAHNCQIDIAKNVLMIQGKPCTLMCSGSIGCYRIAVKDKIEIPPMSEMVVEGNVIGMKPDTGGLFVVEPREQVLKEQKTLIARSLTYGKAKAPVRIMNISAEPQIINRGTNIAVLNPVAEVKKVNKTESNVSVSIPSHLLDLYDRTVKGMTVDQQKDVAQLLCKYASVFSESDSDIGRTGIIKHKIPTGTTQPIKQRPRRVPVHMNEEVDHQIDNMLQEKIIQPSKSPWASAIVMVKKKDGSSRFCVDYRKLNDATIKDAYPLPRIDESLDQLAGSTWFSCLDLNSGYWQVETDPQDKEKTAFTSRKGLFEFNVMPFGLCNAPATFERLMETVLAGLHWQICLIYLDDVIVSGKSFDDMVNNLRQIFERFQQAGLKLKPRKCTLFSKQVEFLGHVISEQGIKTDPKKTECIDKWPTPKNVHDVRAFLGLCGYYRKFVYSFSEIAKPLYKLTEKKTPFVWSDECSVAFEMLKDKLVQSPILAHPDFTKPFILDVDASEKCIGAVLSQETEDGECVIAYGSRTLTQSERRYCVTRKELLALVNFVKFFRHYLYGKKFHVRTDHGSLRWLMNFKNPEGQVARWIEFLSAFHMDIEHRPGRSHGNADGVSRIPCRQCGKNEDNEEDQKLYQVSQNESSTNIDVPRLKDAQDKDRDISFIKHWLEKGERPTKQAISSESWFVKSLLNQWSRLSVQQELLVRRVEELETDEIKWQVVIPLSMRRDVLKYAHDVKTAAHLGIRKTLGKVRLRFYWPGLQNDVKIYVGGCEKCARKKNPNPTKVAPMQIVRSGFPMERIALDILGPLPVTEHGNKYILVISDYFTKWTESFAMPNMEAKTCAKILVEEVIVRLGVPNKIHSDQGRQFESHLFAEVCEMLQIEKTRTTAYHPQSDGMVERFNRTLCSMLSTLVDDNQRNWDTLLPFVMMAYRSSAHETVGMSPNVLMLGREVSTPLDIQFEMPHFMKTETVNDWVWQLKENLETSHTLVREFTGMNMHRQKKYHDLKSRDEQFMIDDYVYVYFPVVKIGHTPKLTSFWRGPVKIERKISDVLYEINFGTNARRYIIHADRLKKAKGQRLIHEADYEQFPEDQLVEQTETDENAQSIDSQENEGSVAADETDQPVSYSRFGRQRKKPVWFHDYVCSIFSRSMSDQKKRKGPNIKITPRKTVQSTICPVCKDDIKGQNFRQHIVDCADSRLKCQECPKTFKKKEYLKSHMKRKHQSQAMGSVADDLKLSASSGESDSGSDWNKDPDIELSDEDSKDEIAGKEEDKRTVNDLTSGRIIRRPFGPPPVFNPTKRKMAEETEVHDKIESPKKQDYVNLQKAKSSEGLGSYLNVSFSMKGKTETQMTQSFELVQNGEALITSKVARSVNPEMGNININLGDFIRSTIRPEDVCIQTKDGVLSLDIKYK